MDIKTMPKETASELLIFLAENEEFDSVNSKLTEGDLKVEEVRAVLREIGEALRRESNAERKEKYDVKSCQHLSKEAKRIISYLSPREEQTLLSAFGLIDKKASLPKVKGK
jgi:hypothetical protein